MGKLRDFFVKEDTDNDLHDRVDMMDAIANLSQKVEESQSQREMIQRNAEDLAWQVLNMPNQESGDGDISHENRIKRNNRAERMYREESIVRRAVNISNEYVWARGMQKPVARHPSVQRVIDSFWEDNDNRLAITSFEAQIETNIDFELHGELFFIVFDDGKWGSLNIEVTPADNDTNSLAFNSQTDQGHESYIAEHLRDELASEGNFDYTEDLSGGKFNVSVTGPLPKCPVKVSKIHPNEISTIIKAENHSLKPRYFKRERPKYRYDFNTDRYTQVMGNDGPVKEITYYESFEFPQERYERIGSKPPAHKIGRGKILHRSVNKGSFSTRGNADIWPALKWASLLNDFFEWRVTRLRALYNWSLKQKVKGGVSQVQQQAAKLITNAQTPGSRFTGNPGEYMPTASSAHGALLTENESVNTEPFGLNTGSGDASADILALKSQTGLSIGLTANYLGDTTNGTLANATAMEAPILKRFSARQEFFEKLIEALLDHAIKKAVDEGLIPEDADLTYKNDLPNIQERNIPELVNAISQLSARLDPYSMNYKLKRFLLLQGLIYLGINNPQKVVEDVYPPNAEEEENEKMMAMGFLGGGGLTQSPDKSQGEVPKSEVDPDKNVKHEGSKESMTPEELDSAIRDIVGDILKNEESRLNS